jgi:hypothetical protein
MHWGRYYKAFPKPHLKWNSQLMLLATLVFSYLFYFFLPSLFKLPSLFSTLPSSPASLFPLPSSCTLWCRRPTLGLWKLRQSCFGRPGFHSKWPCSIISCTGSIETRRCQPIVIGPRPETHFLLGTFSIQFF